MGDPTEKTVRGRLQDAKADAEADLPGGRAGLVAGWWLRVARPWSRTILGVLALVVPVVILVATGADDWWSFPTAAVVEVMLLRPALWGVDRSTVGFMRLDRVVSVFGAVILCLALTFGVLFAALTAIAAVVDRLPAAYVFALFAVALFMFAQAFEEPPISSARTIGGPVLVLLPYRLAWCVMIAWSLAAVVAAVEAEVIPTVAGVTVGATVVTGALAGLVASMRRQRRVVTEAVSAVDALYGVLAADEASRRDVIDAHLRVDRALVTRFAVGVPFFSVSLAGADLRRAAMKYVDRLTHDDEIDRVVYAWETHLDARLRAASPRALKRELRAHCREVRRRLSAHVDVGS